MSYITIALNHFRSLQRAAAQADVHATLDMADFRLELKGHGRYFNLYPQFAAGTPERMTYTAEITDQTTGFIGWRPYRPISWPGVSDKLTFKTIVRASGFLSPRLLETPEREGVAYVLKVSRGSFCEGLRGPFRAGASAAPHSPAITVTSQPDSSAPAEQATRGVEFAEEFIAGKIVKIWYWGPHPVFAHLQPYPTVIGDGSATVQDLLTARLARINQRFTGLGDQAAIPTCLAFHGVSQGTVLPQGQELWFDYRYARRYASRRATAATDNAWQDLPDAAKAAGRQLGELIGGLLTQHFGAPILYALDAVVDDHGHAWWLEANTNPMVPPEAYRAMLSSMFSLPPTEEAPSNAALVHDPLAVPEPPSRTSQT